MEIIAHRGFAGDKPENSIEAFRHSATSDAWGIETDVRISRDGVFFLYHDDGKVERANSSMLKDLATLQDYLKICKDGDKTAVIEIKEKFSANEIKNLLRAVRDADYLVRSVFISFEMQNLLEIRAIIKTQPVQYLTRLLNKKLIQQCAKDKIDLDVRYTAVDKSRVKLCQKSGLRINVYTVNNLKLAKRYKKLGVDYLTTDYADLGDKLLVKK